MRRLSYGMILLALLVGCSSMSVHTDFSQEVDFSKFEPFQYRESDRTLAIHFDVGVDTPGPVPISFVIWEEKTKGEKSDTRIIVFTDADFLTNVYLNQYSNAAMGLNVVNWLSELDYAVFLDQKEVNVERLDLTSKQRRMITALLFLMPLFIAAGGILVWMRR